MLLPRVTNAPFGFRDPNGNIACCRIEVIPARDERVVVIATELADNPGISITSASEFLASSVCKLLKIMPRQLVLIEHYDSASYRATARPDSFDRVIFGAIKENFDPVFQHPAWRPMQPSDWHDLGLTPRG